MKRILKTTITLIAVGVSTIISAQQIPLYGQYYFNRFLYNPALTGESGRTEAYLQGRRQWTALEGYQTRAITLSGTPKSTNVGLGLYYINDVNNLAKSNSAYGNYAYRIPLTEKSKLMLGFALGVYDYSFNMQNIVLADMNDNAVALLNNESGPALDASIGGAYTNSGFMIGVAFPQLFSGPVIYKDNYINSVEHNLENHYTVMASYDIPVGKAAKLQPLIMYKGVRGVPGQVDANLVLDWMDKAWLGIAYRDQYAVTGMAGITISNLVRLGYSYDWSMSDYSTALGGSHELTFGIVMNAKDQKQQTEEMLAAQAARQKKQMQEVDSLIDERDSRIEKLEWEVKRLANSPNRVDTVVVVKKEVTTVQVPSGSSGTTTTPRTTPETKPKTTGTSGGGNGNFMVVAGSFSQEENADKFAAELRGKGMTTYTYYDANRRLHYVHTGRFTDKDEARAFAKANSIPGLTLWVKTLN